MTSVSCIVKGCTLEVVGLNLCVNHWRRLQKYGSPAVLRNQSKFRIGTTDQERFERQIRKSSTCWLWVGSTDSDGYGVFRGTINDVTYVKAHRYSLAADSDAPLLRGSVVMHLCDNPRCVNPKHLRLGTTRENLLDKIAKGRSGLPKGALVEKVELTDDQRHAIAVDPRPNVEVAGDFRISAIEVKRIRAAQCETSKAPNAFVVGSMECAIKRCDEKATNLGLCPDHWRRCKEFGGPTLSALSLGRWIALPIMQRLLSKIHNDGDCWMWTGFTDRDGYGRIRGTVANTVITKAHTLSYTLHTGELVPKGLVVMHSCDRPGCINPDHLRIGTYAENSRDMSEKSRGGDQKGEKGSKAKLTESQVIAILRDSRKQAEIAEAYGVSATTIGSIKQRKSWSHIAIDQVAKATRIGMRGETQWNAKLTGNDVSFIRLSNAAGKDLAKKFSVTPQAITNIRKGRIWKHIK